MHSKRQSGPFSMLRGPGRMVVLALCAVVLLYVLYKFAFSGPRYVRPNNLPISHQQWSSYKARIPEKSVPVPLENRDKHKSASAKATIAIATFDDVPSNRNQQPPVGADTRKQPPQVAKDIQPPKAHQSRVEGNNRQQSRETGDKKQQSSDTGGKKQQSSDTGGKKQQSSDIGGKKQQSSDIGGKKQQSSDIGDKKQQATVRTDSAKQSKVKIGDGQWSRNKDVESLKSQNTLLSHNTIKKSTLSMDIVKASVIHSDLFTPQTLSANAFYTTCNDQNEKTFKDLQRIVHLDLKGAPPHMAYFRQLFPALQKMGATGLLIEYEDMFPYWGVLKGIAATNAYSVSDIKELMKLAQNSGLTTIIPLIQTFGHMEFVLKYGEYKDLRESSDTPQVIRPLYDKSLALIKTMIGQVAQVHGDAIKHFHIGCDEVYRLGTGKIADYMKANSKTATDVFFAHVLNVISGLPAGVTPLMWDDMFRKLPLEVIQKSGLRSKVEPMVWQYAPRPQDHLPKDIWTKYRDVFDKVWAASSFKGATGSYKYVTDPAPHLSNHLNWIEIIKANKNFFRGTILTGWQRYDHFATLCELLPVAIPTLALSLQALSKGCFDKSVHEFVSKEILQCTTTLNITLPRYIPKSNVTDNYRPGMCTFPGSRVYDGAQLLRLMELYYMQESVQSRLKSWMNRYNLAMKFSSTGQMMVIKRFLDNLSNQLLALRRTMRSALLEIYDANVESEWMLVNLLHLDEQVNEARRKIIFFKSFDTWERRPFTLPHSIPSGKIDEALLQQRLTSLNAVVQTTRKPSSELRYNINHGVSDDHPALRKVLPTSGRLQQNVMSGKKVRTPQPISGFKTMKERLQGGAGMPSGLVKKTPGGAAPNMDVREMKEKAKNGKDIGTGN